MTICPVLDECDARAAGEVLIKLATSRGLGDLAISARLERVGRILLAQLAVERAVRLALDTAPTESQP